jgi:hypothetical protein
VVFVVRVFASLFFSFHDNRDERKKERTKGRTDGRNCEIRNTKTTQHGHLIYACCRRLPRFTIAFYKSVNAISIKQSAITPQSPSLFARSHKLQQPPFPSVKLDSPTPRPLSTIPEKEEEGMSYPRRSSFWKRFSVAVRLNERDALGDIERAASPDILSDGHPQRALS